MGKKNKEQHLKFQIEGLDKVKVEPDCYYCAKPIDMRVGKSRNGYVHQMCEAKCSTGTSLYPNGPDSPLHIVGTDGYAEDASVLTYDELEAAAQRAARGDAPAAP